MPSFQVVYSTWSNCSVVVPSLSVMIQPIALLNLVMLMSSVWKSLSAWNHTLSTWSVGTNGKADARRTCWCTAGLFLSLLGEAKFLYFFSYAFYIQIINFSLFILWYIYFHTNYNCSFYVIFIYIQIIIFPPFHLFKPYAYTGTNYQVFLSNKHLINIK